MPKKAFNLTALSLEEKNDTELIKAIPMDIGTGEPGTDPPTASRHATPQQIVEMTTHETRLNDVDNGIATLQGEIGAHVTAIEGLQSDVSGIESVLESIDTELDTKLGASDAIRSRTDIDSIDGGGSNGLASVPTVGLMAHTLWGVPDANRGLVVYRLENSSDVSSGILAIRPADYNASTNMKCWKRVSVAREYAFNTTVAYIDTQYGHNGSALRGDRNRPFASIQAAFDSGARAFRYIYHSGVFSDPLILPFQAFPESIWISADCHWAPVSINAMDAAWQIIGDNLDRVKIDVTFTKAGELQFQNCLVGEATIYNGYMTLLNCRVIGGLLVMQDMPSGSGSGSGSDPFIPGFWHKSETRLMIANSQFRHHTLAITTAHNFHAVATLLPDESAINTTGTDVRLGCATCGDMVWAQNF